MVDSGKTADLLQAGLKAIEHDRPDLVDDVLTREAAQNDEELGVQLLSKAVDENRYEVVERLVTQHAVTPNGWDREGYPPVYHAIRRNDLKAFDVLERARLSMGTAVADALPRRAIFMALPEKADGELANRVIANLKRTMPADRNRELWTPLVYTATFHALKNRNWGTAEALLDYYQSVEAAGTDVLTHLTVDLFSNDREADIDPEAVAFMDARCPDEERFRSKPLKEAVGRYGGATMIGRRDAAVYYRIVEVLLSNAQRPGRAYITSRRSGIWGQDSASYLYTGKETPHIDRSPLEEAVYVDMPGVFDLFEKYDQHPCEHHETARVAMTTALKYARLHCFQALVDRGVSPFIASDDPLALIQDDIPNAEAFRENVQQVIETESPNTSVRPIESEEAAKQPLPAPGRF